MLQSSISNSIGSGIKTIKLFCHNQTAVKLQEDFDALCEMLSQFSSEIFVLATKE